MHTHAGNHLPCAWTSNVFAEGVGGVVVNLQMWYIHKIQTCEIFVYHLCVCVAPVLDIYECRPNDFITEALYIGRLVDLVLMWLRNSNLLLPQSYSWSTHSGVEIMVLTAPWPFEIHHFCNLEVSNLKSGIEFKIEQHIECVKPFVQRPRNHVCILDPFGFPTYPGTMYGFFAWVNSSSSESVSSALISLNFTRFLDSFFSRRLTRLRCVSE